jgi:hypothetical protein
MFNLDTPDDEVRPLLIEISINSNSNIRLPSNWTPVQSITPLSLPVNAPVEEDYLT